MQVLDGRRITERGGGRHAAPVPPAPAGDRVQAGAGALKASADAPPAMETAGRGLRPGPRVEKRCKPVRASAAAAEAGGGQKRGADRDAGAEGAQPKGKNRKSAMGVALAADALGRPSLKPDAGREGLLGAIKPLPPPAAAAEAGSGGARAVGSDPGAQPAAGSSAPAAAPAEREAHADAPTRPPPVVAVFEARAPPREAAQPAERRSRGGEAQRFKAGAAVNATLGTTAERVGKGGKARKPKAGAGAERGTVARGAAVAALLQRGLAQEVGTGAGSGW